MACEHCRFWEPDKHIQNAGQCRIRPPVLPDRNNKHWDGFGYWPITWADAWCGEFRGKGADD